jgi:hypothetical protein
MPGSLEMLQAENDYGSIQDWTVDYLWYKGTQEINYL